MALSRDLRLRIVDLVASGVSRREAVQGGSFYGGPSGQASE